MSQARIAVLSDVPTMAVVLAEAFQDDPLLSWEFPDPESRPRLLRSLFAYMSEHFYVPAGHGTVTEGGAALWQPPGVEMDDAFWAEHTDALINALEGQVDRIVAMLEALDEIHPRDRHWYLPIIGVRPSEQGRGRGSALLSLTLRTLDADGESAYLEASTLRNRELYERHGFEVMSEFRFEDAPPLWPMWRRSQTS